MLPPPTYEQLIGTVYEASAFPDRWPATLDQIAWHFGARGGNLIRSTASSIEIVSSPSAQESAREWEQQGWNQHNTRVSRLLERGSYPGFLTDSHLHSEEELRTLPIYAEFLNPRDMAAGAATLIQGARDDGLIIAIEAFASHEASRAASPLLDRLRPHIARAAALSSQIQAARAETLIQAFDAVGSPIALLDNRGKVIGAGRCFEAEAVGLTSDGPHRLRMVDPESDRRFALALTELDRRGTGMSIAIRDRDQVGAGVLHLIPARHDARELFSRVTIFAILARTGNAVLPASDIIAALFDLTPAEAKVARAIAEGLTPSELAKASGVSAETVRSQLKRVLAKTSTRRQSELAALLAKLA